MHTSRLTHLCGDDGRAERERIFNEDLNCTRQVTYAKERGPRDCEIRPIVAPRSGWDFFFIRNSEANSSARSFAGVLIREAHPGGDRLHEAFAGLIAGHDGINWTRSVVVFWPSTPSVTGAAAATRRRRSPSKHRSILTDHSQRGLLVSHRLS